MKLQPPQHPPYSNPETEKTRQSILATIAKIAQALTETMVERHLRKLEEQKQEQGKNNINGGVQ